MSRGATVAGVERAADWDAQWRVEPLDPAAAEAEERTPRWRGQERILRGRLGGFAGPGPSAVGAGGGGDFPGVRNRHAPAYRLWMATMKRRGTWPLGTEEPFSTAELAGLARAAGGRPLEPVYGSFVGSLVNHGLNPALFKLGPPGLG